MYNTNTLLRRALRLAISRAWRTFEVERHQSTVLLFFLVIRRTGRGSLCVCHLHLQMFSRGELMADLLNSLVLRLWDEEERERREEDEEDDKDEKGVVADALLHKHNYTSLQFAVLESYNSQ